ncbi:MAG: type II secretion system protein [Candidatus Omnitrophica bacterium]|nr:type II secretion system protein [Candidatus Omnitrophota bacterium]
MFERRSGFTLLELIVVIVILGILATLGFTQYTKMVEKGRTAEARTVLGQLRSAQLAYHLEYGVYVGWDACGCTPLSVSVPENCQTTHYFRYYCCWANGRVRAERCTGTAGKQPGALSNYSIDLMPDGTWSGTAGYY